MRKDYEVAPFPDIPLMNQMKTYKDRVTRKAKAKACIYAAVAPVVFNRIMALKLTKEICEFLKGEYEGDERIRA